MTVKCFLLKAFITFYEVLESCIKKTKNLDTVLKIVLRRGSKGLKKLFISTALLKVIFKYSRFMCCEYVPS